MQSVSRPMFYFCSGFCCPILYIVYHALCCSSNLFKMLFHYYFYLSWKMEMGNNGKESLLVESWFNVHSRESYMRLSTDRGSKVLDERKKIHSSNHEFISIYSPHLIMHIKCSWKTTGSFWATPGNEKGEGGCQKQMFSRRNMHSFVMIRHTNLNQSHS